MSKLKYFLKGNKYHNSGFTIIELMIATAVFSVVLLMLVLGVTKISQAYIKGVVYSETQNAAQSIVSDISKNIEFNSGDIGSTIGPTPTAGLQFYFCMGERAYFYQLGNEVVGNGVIPGEQQAYHGLIAEDGDTTCPVPKPDPSFNSPTTLTSAQQEFLSPNMRLAVLNVIPVAGLSNLYEVDVKVVYGSNDLLCNSSSDPSSCSSTTTMPFGNDYIGSGVRCKDGVGSQFCAVSSLEVYVKSTQ